MSTDAAVKPSYLGLLNAISIAERDAGGYLAAWAHVTPDPELARVLRLVAAREATHGEVFRQRIERLGFAVRDKADPGAAERLRVYGDPGRSDADKIRAFPRDEAGTDAILTSLDERASDPSVDTLTRETLRWYVAEERDSGDLLRGAYARVLSRTEPAGAPADAAGAA